LSHTKRVVIIIVIFQIYHNPVLGGR